MTPNDNATYMLQNLDVFALKRHCVIWQIESHIYVPVADGQWFGYVKNEHLGMPPSQQNVHLFYL